MKVMPISFDNNCRKPQFTSKFSINDVESLLIEAKSFEKAAGVPQLYTLLKYLGETGGKIAKIVDRNVSESPLRVKTKKALIIDGHQTLLAERSWESGFCLLKDFIVGEKSSNEMIKMPERIFEQEWWKNRKVTEEDVKKLALSI